MKNEDNIGNMYTYNWTYYCIERRTGMTDELKQWEYEELQNQVPNLIVEELEKIKMSIKQFMFDKNPNSSESDYACNYILNEIIEKRISKLKGSD